MNLQFVIVDIVILLTVIVVLWKYGFPTIEKISEMVRLLNSKGGIILLLWFTSMIFFAVGIRLCYFGVNLMLEHKISSDNALILSAFNWITGAAFGGAFSAMIKTMTGEEEKKPLNGEPSK